jgi:hypothetical protein
MKANTQQNKKPAPAQPPTAKTNGKAQDADDDLDDDVEVDETEASDDDDKETPGWQKTQRLPPAKREAVLLANLVAKLARRQETIANWPEESKPAKEALEQASACLKTAADALAKLPDSFKARIPASKSSKAELEAGSIIRITDKQLPNYDGILDADQVTGIKVTEIRGNRVVATTPDGAKVIFARGHVCLDETASA